MSYSIRLLSIRNKKNLEQYPIDYTKEIFKKYANRLNYDRHLFVEKDGINVYYTYLRRLNSVSGDYFGFCFVFTGEYIEDVKGLFEVCEDLILRILRQGELLKGSLPLSLEKINDFNTKSPEIKRIDGWFNGLVNKKDDFIVPFKGATFENSSTELSLKKDDEIILFNIKHYNHINYHTNIIQSQKQDEITPIINTPTESKSEVRENEGCFWISVISILIFTFFTLLFYYL